MKNIDIVSYTDEIDTFMINYVKRIRHLYIQLNESIA